MQEYGSNAMAARATSGIYSITNTVNGKLYIGSAVNLMNRATYHRWQLRKAEHHSQKLQRAWNKYGEAAFAFKTVLICEPKDLLMYEQIALDALNPVKHGYNMLPTAGSALGMKHSAETRAKMSAKHAGKVMSPESRAKMSERMQGHQHSPEALEKIRASSKSRPLPDAFVVQMSKGKIVSHEVRAKISKSLMGHSVSDEARRKMSEAHKGQPHPPISEETRQRMRVAAQARCAKQAQQKAAA